MTNALIRDAENRAKKRDKNDDCDPDFLHKLAKAEAEAEAIRIHNEDKTTIDIDDDTIIGDWEHDADLIVNYIGPQSKRKKLLAKFRELYRNGEYA